MSLSPPERMVYNIVGMNTIIALTAQYLYLVIVVASICVCFLLKKKKEFLVFAASSFVLSYIIAKILNKVIISPRPQFTDHIQPLIKVASDNGFPSDHTLLSMSIALVVLVYNKKIGSILLVLAALVGISRVLAHAHHWIDVFGSIGIALFGVGVILLVRRAYYTKK